MERLVKAVNVTIIFDSRKVQCEGHCGPDWSSPETVETAKKRLNERFGKTVKLVLLDLSAGGKTAPVWQKRITGDNLNVPLLLVNNEVRIPGEFDIRQMMD